MEKRGIWILKGLKLKILNIANDNNKQAATTLNRN